MLTFDGSIRSAVLFHLESVGGSRKSGPVGGCTWLGQCLSSIQCFDTVGCTIGRASGVEKASPAIPRSFFQYATRPGIMLEKEAEV